MAKSPSDEIDTFREKLTKILIDHHISQGKLAKASGLTDSQISELKTGKAPTRLTITPVVKCLKGLIKLQAITTVDELNSWLLSYFTDKGEDYIPVDKLIPKGQELLALLDSPKYSTWMQTELIGREGDIQTILTKLLNTDLQFLTLTGLPGIGKTELARQIEKVCELREFFDVVKPIYLEETERDFDRIFGLIKTIFFNIDTQKSILLILDNCEQIIDLKKARRELYGLLDERKGSKILATSRITFSVEEYQVLPLEIPKYTRDEPLEELQKYAAVKLLLSTARYRDKTFTPREEEAETIADICIALDGIPLALKIAGSLVKDLELRGVQEVIRNKKFQGVTDTFSESVRHESLYQLFEASYHLLNEQEKMVFRRFAIFDWYKSYYTAAIICRLTDFPLHDFSAIDIIFGQIDSDIINIFKKLGEHNLIVAHAGVLIIPHNTIREYARQKLESDTDEAEKVRRKYLDYYYTLYWGNRWATNNGPPNEEWIDEDGERHKLVYRKNRKDLCRHYLMLEHNYTSEPELRESIFRINDECRNQEVAQIVGDKKYQQIEKILEKWVKINKFGLLPYKRATFRKRYTRIRDIIRLRGLTIQEKILFYIYLQHYRRVFKKVPYPYWWE